MSNFVSGASWARSAKLLFVLLLSAPALGGCWDRLEIEERAVVLGISVDTASQQAEVKEAEVSHLSGAFSAPEPNLIRVAAQIALPGRIPLGPGEGGGGGKGGSESTVWVIDVVGHSIDDALMNLQQQISGRLFFGHLRVIVVSEAVAKRGLENLNDYLRRNSEVRRMAWMLIAKGNALKLIKAAPELERVPALYLLSTMDSAVKLGKFPVNYVGMFWSNAAKKGQEGFLPYVEIKPKQNVEISGMAYFKNDKMVGSTKPFEIAAYMAVKGLNPAGYRGFVQAEEPSETVMVYATSRKSVIETSIRDGVPHIRVSIFTEINLEEKVSEQFSVDTADFLREIEAKNRKALVSASEKLIEETQKTKTDIFGFGEYVRAKHPRFWRQQVKSKDGWQELYPRIEIEVVANSKVRRIGMKAK
ncbi:Ger(x)C family spore germination protein [Cohnella sp. GCM10027633]|uniref:Ger(x)C family spore germination protein n=1 Tax=unclassified Cohnella TaxID=2636738 RepID=UPI00362AEE41